MSKRQDATLADAILAWLIMILVLLALNACRPTAPLIPTPTSDRTSTEESKHLTLTPAQTKASQPTPTQPATTATPDCLSAGGELTSAHFYSEQLENDLYFHIYLPPCYNSASNQRFPVVYLLHGLSYTNNQWPRLKLVNTMDSLIAQREIAPFIIIMPLEAIFAPPQTSHFGDALILDLIPWVDNHYKTLPEKTYRGIGGVSRGAAWAVHLGFEHYDLFASVGAHSLPLFEADGGHLTAWMTQPPLEELPRFFIDIGRNDQEWKTTQTFADLLDENNIPHEWYLFNNGHTEVYWTNHLDQYLHWYAQNW
jgi:enterochelin esterase-like enzyme